MDKAFQIILNALTEELTKQGFTGPESMDEKLGKAYLFRTENVAYQVVFEDEREVFALRSNAYDEEGNFAHDWKQLSMWLFDKNEGTEADAQSIANDFVDVVGGSKRVAAVQTAKKKKKKNDDEREVDTIFFFNRLVGIFPELKDEMNRERITYGQVRLTVMARDVVAPKIQKLALDKPNSDAFSKVKNLINEMYKSGDADLRSIITAGVLNNISDETAIARIREDFSDDLAKVYKCARKLIGKNIKPEKVKKPNRIVASALDNEVHR
ncbi:MAG: hypothetical protein Q4C42_03370 [Clostridia bacterium]|nr:hypothetical protein [Clostridia bacterium]